MVSRFTLTFGIYRLADHDHHATYQRYYTLQLICKALDHREGEVVVASCREA